MRWIVAILLFSFCSPILGQHKEFVDTHNCKINEFLVFKTTETEAADNYHSLINRLKQAKKNKSKKAFLRTIFYRTHKWQLGEYQKFATVSETMTNRSFGCLSGTALYAHILDDFDYDYRILRLPNHVFIEVEVEGTLYAIESTLADTGFFRIHQSFLEKTKLRNQDLRTITSINPIGNWDLSESFESYQIEEINLKELSGLQDFNLAIKRHLEGKHLLAYYYIKNAYDKYPNGLHLELMQMIINKILKSDLIDKSQKETIINRYLNTLKSNKISQTK